MHLSARPSVGPPAHLSAARPSACLFDMLWDVDVGLPGSLSTRPPACPSASPPVYFPIRLSVCLSICLFACLPVYLPVRQLMCSSAHQSFRPSCLSAHMLARLSACLRPICLPTRLPVRPSVCPSVCLFVSSPVCLLCSSGRIIRRVLFNLLSILLAAFRAFDLVIVV